LDCIVKDALKALNRLVADGVLLDYAIGGAIGASFYLPAMQTEDVDAFVFLPASSSSILVSLTPVYNALKEQGGVVEHEHVRFGDWPLQILTDATPLIAEAIRKALPVDFEGVPTKVFRPEHLCAIALQTGRAKDYARVTMFLERGEVERDTLAQLADRYKLAARLRRALESADEQENT
jgi:hypothetical protein